MEHHENINGRWLQFKDSVIDSATQIIGRGNEKKPQKPWVTDENNMIFIRRTDKPL